LPGFLDGRTALVTGASSGIGEAYARALRARGCRLVLVARREERLRALAAELDGGAVEVVPADLADPAGPERLHAEVARRGLEVDLLVNNAGVGQSGAFHEEPLSRALAMLDLNARAAMVLTHLYLPGMIARRRGFIVNVVSTSAFQPDPYLAVYGATKAFLLSLTEAIHTEIAGSGVTVQALCPGLTATEFQQTAGTDKTAFNKTGAMTPAAVAETSLRALERGTLRVVPGLANRATAAMVRFTPGWLTRRTVAALLRPRPEGR
jgi:short-subunit dehydrogenase